MDRKDSHRKHSGRILAALEALDDELLTAVAGAGARKKAVAEKPMEYMTYRFSDVLVSS